jgi:hypothetical protein
MTDRVHSLVVVLDADMRVDDAQGLIDAIRHMRNVVDVQTEVADVASMMAEARVRSEMRMKLFAVLDLAATR